MTQVASRLWVASSIAIGCLVRVSSVQAQIVPDNTLPINSTVTPGCTVCTIDGGTVRGANLFHSFSEFSVPTGGEAFFNNTTQIQNILTRVTGNSVSNIDGLIRANGTANLFLINPNGIIFGENSSLNVGGSFVASTASSIKFADGTEFSAVNPSTPPLLTISVPIGLQFNGTEGDIVVRSGKPKPLASTNPFTEVEDAGQTLDTSQTVNSQSSGTSFDAISGTLSDNSDVDLYQLFLTEGQPLSATTVGGTDVDTQLFLFDATGLGLHSNDDTGGTYQSTVPADQPFTPTVSGTYYLGISSYGNDPLSPLGNIFPNFDEPNSPGAESPLSGWNGNGEESGAYTINLINSNRSTANNSTGLQVPAGQSLLLVGGDVRLEGGQIVSPGSRVKLGGVAGQGTVGLSGTAGDWRLSFPDGVALSDVSLSNSAIISVRAGGGGSIAVMAQNVTLSEGSRLRAGINGGLGFAGAQAGDIELKATETINLADSSSISNSVLLGGTGNAGNINITAGSLSVTNGGQMTTLTSGQGRAGNVNIMVRDAASFDGEDIFGTQSSIITGVVEGAIGDGGDLSIMAGSLSLTNGAILSAITYGQGSAGNVNITVRDAVLLDGIARGNTGIFTTVVENGVGNGGTINIRAGSLSIIGESAIAADTNGQQGRGGNINLDIEGTLLLSGGGTTTAPTGESSRITLGVQPEGEASGGNLRINAGSLVLTDGGLIKASTQGQGDAGNIDITADVVNISGSVPTSGLPSGLFTSSDTTGKAGYIIINTQTFRIADGAALSARSRGDGRGGDITVNAARTFEALNGGQLITTTFGRGQAGSITINAGEQLVIAGSDPNYAARLAKFPNPVASVVANAITETGAASGLFANTEPSSAGRGGDIQIATGQLTVQEGAQLITSTSGNGRAGDITVKAPDIQLSGATSGLFAQTSTSANAGNLTIQPRSNGQSVRVNLQDGAQISASTSSRGNGGELTITAPESITLTGNGSVIAAETGGSGTGGNLNLQTGTLNIQNQAEVTVSSEGTGSAGSLFVDANQIYLNNTGRIRADTSGGGGNITLRSPLILLRNGSSITTNARGSNITGGNITIDTDNLVAVPKENSDISANAEGSFGGRVIINAQGIFGTQFRDVPTPLSDITATSEIGPEFNGTVQLNTPDIDPNRGLIDLPTAPVDTQVSQVCQVGARQNQNSFIITGRGGLPPNPRQVLRSQAVQVDWVTLDAPANNPTGDVQSRETQQQGSVEPYPQIDNNVNTKPTEIVEAQGWVVDANGNVVLVATAPTATPHSSWQTPDDCRTVESMKRSSLLLERAH